MKGIPSSSLINAILVSLFSVGLFVGGSSLLLNSFFAIPVQNLSAIYDEPHTQWAVFSFAAACLVMLTFLQFRAAPARFWHWNSPDLWLFIVLLDAGCLYVSRYVTASQSTQLLTFFWGAIFGKFVAVWVVCSARRYHQISTVPWIVLLVVELLTIASLWPPDTFSAYFYRDQLRWGGPWNNP